jgi:hypothetical protein
VKRHRTDDNPTARRDQSGRRRALAQLALDDIRSKVTCKAWEVQPRPKTSSEYRQLLRWLEANGLIARDPFNPGVIHATVPPKRAPAAASE